MSSNSTQKPQSAKLQVFSGIPWATDLWWRNDANRGQAEGCAALVQATECQRHLVILRFCQLLKEVHQGLCRCGGPTYRLNWKNLPWQWGPYQQQVCQQLKDALCIAPVLLFPDPRLPYTVVTNAFGLPISGVLKQEQGNGLQPLAFLNRQLKPIEQRYSVHEREVAAIVYCLQS